MRYSFSVVQVVRYATYSLKRHAKCRNDFFSFKLSNVKSYPTVFIRTIRRWFPGGVPLPFPFLSVDPDQDDDENNH